MTTRKLRVFAGLALAFAVGCVGSGQVRVPERKPPARFSMPNAAGPSAATLSYRHYFRDPQLIALMEQALANSFDLQIALQRVELARASVAASTGALMPHVDANLGAGIRKFGRYTMDGAGNRSTEITPGRIVPTTLPDYMLGLQSTWEVDLWGKLRSQRKSAIAQYLATIEGAQLVRTALVADIASSYYELLALDQAREVVATTLVQRGEALAVVRWQKEAGRTNELAVQQFEALVAETRALEQELTQRTFETENRIHVLVGRYPQPIARDKASLFDESSSTVSAGYPSELLRNRPDIRAAELAVEAAKYDVKAARAAFFPTLTLSAGAGFQAFSPAYLFSTPDSLIYNASAGLVAPLINRAALKSHLRGASALQVQAIYEYQRTVLEAYVEVINRLKNLETTARTLSAKKEQKAALVRAVETADTLYKAGKASYLEVLLAQQNTLTTDLELIETHQRERLSRVAIYQALGGGWQ